MACTLYFCNLGEILKVRQYIAETYHILPKGVKMNQSNTSLFDKSNYYLFQCAILRSAKRLTKIQRLSCFFFEDLLKRDLLSAECVLRVLTKSSKR